MIDSRRILPMQQRGDPAANLPWAASPRLWGRGALSPHAVLLQKLILPTAALWVLPLLGFLVQSSTGSGAGAAARRSCIRSCVTTPLPKPAHLVPDQPGWRDEATAQVEPTCFAARLLLEFFFPLFFFLSFFFLNTLHIPLGFCDTRTSNDALHNLSITMPRSYCRSPLSPATRREDHFLRAICFSRASSLAVI